MPKFDFDSWNTTTDNEVFYENNAKPKKMPQEVKLTEGAKVCVIKNAIDYEQSQSVTFEIDIIDDGNEYGYFQNKYNKLGFWDKAGKMYVKYDDVRPWKAFITCVEKSNEGFTWNNESGDVNQLIGKKVVCIFKKKELKKNGKPVIGTFGKPMMTVQAYQFRSLEALNKGELDTQRSIVVTENPMGEDIFKDIQATYTFEDGDLPF